MNEIGRTLVLLGLGLVAIGAFLILSGKLAGLGRLPGDFSYESDNVKVYFPLATSLVLSAIVTILLYFFRR